MDTTPLQRRTLLQALLAGALARPAWVNATPAAQERIALAWQAADTGFEVGILRVDWDAAELQPAARVPLPSRAHGLLPLADGDVVVVANRPGRWLLRLDAQGQVQARMDEAAPGRSFNGHVEGGPGSPWLFTTETRTADQAGFISVRDPRTLQRVAEFESGGIDPHQLLLAADGALLVAHGGIARDAAGRKREGERMAPSLTQLSPQGKPQGLWTLPDAQLSIRHLAWSTGPAPLLGVALQAEHADARERAQAPVLAVWDGHALHLPTAEAQAGGYVGDICAGPRDGFILSAQKKGLALWWQPSSPTQLTPMAQLTEPCALVPLGGGALLGAGRGLARWQLLGASAMLRWPAALAPDNHAVRLL